MNFSEKLDCLERETPNCMLPVLTALTFKSLILFFHHELVCFLEAILAGTGNHIMGKNYTETVLLPTRACFEDESKKSPMNNH